MQSDINLTIRPLAFDSDAERILEERLYAPSGLAVLPLPASPLQAHYVLRCNDCSGCCRASAARVLEDVGRVAFRAVKYQQFFFREGIGSDCKRCSDWNLRMSEMLEYHSRALIARLEDDVKQLSLWSAQRSRVLHDLGYTTI